jgi:serine/threonine protein kinase
MKSTLCLDDFERTEFLGEGTYGIVYKAKSKTSEEVIAVKSIKLESRDEGIPSTTLREISILRELSPHPNIIQ